MFTIIAGVMFQSEQLHWNHAVAFLCLVAAVYFVFLDSWNLQKERYFADLVATCQFKNYHLQIDFRING